MRRYAIRLVLFLLIGAIINVAVAWGVVLVLPARGHRFGPGTWVRTLAEDKAIKTIRDMRIAIDRTDCHGLLEERFGWMAVDAMCGSPGDVNFICTHVLSAGWPQFSLSADSARGGLPVRARARGKRELAELPLRPIWPGFAINTIFYAGLLWIVFATAGFMRRCIRHVRGRCLHCGYDLRGQPPPEMGRSIKCPECGRSSPLPRGEGQG